MCVEDPFLQIRSLIVNNIQNLFYWVIDVIFYNDVVISWYSNSKTVLISDLLFIHNLLPWLHAICILWCFIISEDCDMQHKKLPYHTTLVGNSTAISLIAVKGRCFIIEKVCISLHQINVQLETKYVALKLMCGKIEYLMNPIVFQFSIMTIIWRSHEIGSLELALRAHLTSSGKIKSVRMMHLGVWLVNFTYHRFLLITTLLKRFMEHITQCG